MRDVLQNPPGRWAVASLYVGVVFIVAVFPIVRASSATSTIPLATGFEFPIGDPESGAPYEVVVDFCADGGSRGRQLGQNLAVDEQPVYAAAAGRVVRAEMHDSWDGIVLIEHLLPSGRVVYTLYGHLSSVGVRTYEDVTRGQPIGVSGPPDSRPDVYKHLHFEVKAIGSIGSGWTPGSCPPSGFERPTDFVAAHLSPAGASR